MSIFLIYIGNWGLCVTLWGSLMATQSSIVILKQVTTLPWYITPKETLYGPIHGIYMG